MKNRLVFISALCFLLLGFTFYSDHANAYSDLSHYKIKTGRFEDANSTNDSLKVFTKKTGWKGTVQKTGQSQTYYKIRSGNISGEDFTKSILQEFKKSTGFDASYEGTGETLKYNKVMTKDSFDLNRTNSILQDFKKTTGFNATSLGVGKQENYVEVISGGYSDETQVKSVLQNFKKDTGFNAFYEGTGKQEKYYEILSGNIEGVDQVKNIINNLKASTGINGTYISTGKTTYQIKTEPVLGSTQVNKVKTFFQQHQLTAASKETGKTGFLNFQIKTTPLIGITDISKAQDFFVKNKRTVTTHDTGKKGFLLFQIQTEPLLGTEKLHKAQSYFQKNHLSVSTVYTGKSVYQIFQIVTAPLLGTERAKKAQTFFHNKKLTSTSTSTGKTAPLYEILTNEFDSYDKTQAAMKKIKSLFGWTATAVKTKDGPKVMYTNYGLTLDSMVDQEMALNPQTDKYRDVTRYVYASFVDLGSNTINANNVNVRSAPSSSGTIVQHLNKGDQVIVLGKTGDWIKVRITWQSAQAADVNYYLKASNFTLGSQSSFQFLKLSESANLDANEVNAKILKGKGILEGKGQTFIDAAKKYHINEIYLISHSLLETGNGTSKLAKGVQYKGKTVYNMYGYGAKDSCPLTCGEQTAYENHWFTPEAAIIGGAQFISSGYIHNDTFKQDTLYKMRWNPVQTWHQYASDIGWAIKQVSNIYNMYHLLNHYTLYFDVPAYK